MADGESPKARPKRVKPDRPRPTTGSFRPTGTGSPRPLGQRPGGQRPGGPRTSGGPRPRPAGASFGPDSRIPRGPDDRPFGDRPQSRGRDDRPFGDRPAGDRPGGDRSGPGRPTGDRPRFDRPRFDGPRPGGDRPRFDGPRPGGDRPRFDGPPPERSGFGFQDRGRDQDVPRNSQPPRRDFSPRPPFGDRPRPGGFAPRPSGPPRFDDRPRPGGFVSRPPARPFDQERGRPAGPDRDRPAGPERDRPAGPDRGPRSFGPRPDYRRPEFPRPTSFNRPGLEPAEAGLVESGDEIVAGRRPVEEAFVARREARRLLVVPQRRAALEKLVLHATSLRIPIVEVEGGSLTALTGFDGHQGIALVVAPRRYSSVPEILARAIERGEPPFVLILDSLEDPQNVGTLLRSAEAAGAHGVIFPTRRQAPLSPAAVKASAGAVEHLLLAPVDDLAGALADLHVAGLRVVGAEAEAPLTVREADLRGPIALVIGSEGQGLGPTVRRRCDLMVRIPMRGAIGSLNASVAGSILLFEATTQRGGVESTGGGGLPEIPELDVVAVAEAVAEMPVAEVAVVAAVAEAPVPAVKPTRTRKPAAVVVEPAAIEPVVAAPELEVAAAVEPEAAIGAPAGPAPKKAKSASAMVKSQAKAARELAKSEAKGEAKLAKASNVSAKAAPKAVVKAAAKAAPKPGKAAPKPAKRTRPIPAADPADDLLP
jgi:23S rRNA (guanosine2251-2'-O)-methyltransferase